MKKLFFSTFAVILCIAFTSEVFAAGKDLQKTYSWKYAINKDGSVVLDNYDCNVTIHIWDKGETEYRLTIDARTRSDEDAAVLDRYLQDLKFSNSSASVTFKDNFWESRNNIMGKMTMKLIGGKSISLTDFSMKGELWIPAGCKFGLRSKYSEINMEDFSGSLTLDLYNDNLYGGSVNGKTTLTDKYSTIEFKEMQELTADLYSSKVDVKGTADLKVESKYSKFTSLVSGTVDINGYSDKYSITKTGDVTFAAKYSDLKTEISGGVNLDCYEGTIIMKEVKDVRITSKYADFQFVTAGDISVVSSYSDKLVAGKAGSLKIDESKYCNYQVDELISSVIDIDGYEDKINIGKIGPDFKEISINGKYGNISVGLSKTTDYRFKAKIQYGKLDFDESMLKNRTKIVENSKIEYDAVKGTEKDGMPVIEINGYQMALKIIEY
jgi:hypothetical protein